MFHDSSLGPYKFTIDIYIDIASADAMFDPASVKNFDFNSLAVFKRTIKCVNFSSHIWFSCHSYVSTICGQLSKCTLLLLE